MKIRLFNDTHKTEMNIEADPEMVNDPCGPWFVLHLRSMDGDRAALRRAQRIARTLCGHGGCPCRPIDRFEVVR